MSEPKPKNVFQDALDRGAQPTAYHALKGVIGTANPRRTLDEAYKLLGPNSSLPDRERLAAAEEPRTCVGCGEAPARGASSYCPDCHFDAFEGGADIG